MEPRRRRQTALVAGAGVLMLLLFTATLHLGDDVSPVDAFTGKVLAPTPVLATSTSAPAVPTADSANNRRPASDSDTVLLEPVVNAYNVSQCIAPACYRRGNLQASCVVEQEVACLEWMATESDCVQGGLPVPPSPVHISGSGPAATPTVRYHMYWAGALTRVALLSLKSFLVTQPAASTRLTLWTTPPGDSAAGAAGSPADLVALLANGDAEAATVLTWAPRVEVRAFRVADEWAAIRADFDGIPADLRLPDAPGGGQPVGFSDLVRLMVLYRYGGVYVDMDVLFVRDLSPLLHVAPFVYGWGCDDDLINTAVFALAARSPVAWALMNAALDRVRLVAPFFERHGRTPGFGADAFHPWKLTKYIARHQIPLNIVSSYLLDPLWMRVDRQEPDGTRLGDPCEAMHAFQDFFSKQVSLPSAPASSFRTVSSSGAPPSTDIAMPPPAATVPVGPDSEAIPFCYPAFAHHWHNHWRTRLRKSSAAFQIEEWLHARLNLSAPTPQAFHGAWGRQG